MLKYIILIGQNYKGAGIGGKMVVVEQYPMKLKKELLDLGAIEIDKTLETLLDGINEPIKELEFINEEGISRTFKLNRKEGILEGRGIKGFFNRYDSENIFVEPIDKGIFRLHKPKRIKKTILEELNINPQNTERVIEILNAAANMKTYDEKWFNLHELMRDFLFDTDEGKLLCLPHLHELDMYNYQIKTVKEVLNRFRGRVLLCDEVGLGKTIEAGIAMSEYIMRGMIKKILILVPPSLVEQWFTEMKRKFNQDFIRYDDQKFKQMGDEAWSHYNKVIASISTAKRKENSKVISRIQYDLVIVDEAHHVKNRKTLAWSFVNSLKKKYIFLLTATPVQNKLEELYNLITLLKPGQLKTYSYFKKNFVLDRQGIEAKNVNHLRELLSDVMIRNKRSDVDVKFTKRNASTLKISLPDEEKILYDEISSFIRKRYVEENSKISRFSLRTLQEEMGSSFMTVIPALNRLSSDERIEMQFRDKLKEFSMSAEEAVRHENSQNPKAIHLLSILRDFDDKMIVFTKYKATQDFIVHFLKHQGIMVSRFNGGMRRKEKEQQIMMFRENAQVLVSTEVGGEGRNLQFCNGMVNYDLPWNPMAIEQRIGRIHRVGQERDVYVYNLAASGTVEYYILELLDKKINMFELVVGELDMILGDIEDEEQFPEMIMGAWVNSNDLSDMEKQIDIIGERLLESKRQYVKMKDLDEKLFGDSFKARKQEV